ncbi:putative eka-like protein [Erysiphe necator]|uniref:Putative eka-like protein n=1 Tax=Uncinula necator TaxID=52586 RepID=A0A0B1NYV1_UNCNE|nr:putative eka-like protein [Erysiphe necator]
MIIFASHSHTHLRRPPLLIPSNGSKNTDTENAFLLKEPAEVFATHQRRERAWHARLLICITVISSINGTLALFEDEIEKEEVSAFKAYIGLAIAKFPAADSSPTPPHIPSHTHPRKTNGYGLGRDKNVAIATPRDMKSAANNVGKKKETPKLLKILQIGEKTWATMVRIGQKKSRIALSNKLQAAPVSRVSHQLSNKDKLPVEDSSDKKFFVRLLHGHEWRKLSPASIHEIIVQKLAISPSLFEKIKPVNLGLALNPCSTEARETILNAGNGLFLSGVKLESATNWIPMIIPTVPTPIRKVQEEIEVSNSILIDEVERVCSKRPAHVKLAPSCGNCGSNNHTDDLRMASIKCRNCGGPHRSDNHRCLARSTRSGTPTKEQMKTFRQVGEREYQAVLRAKAAEESAAAAENTNIDLTISQDTESNCNFDNIQASPIENSTSGAPSL